MNEETFLAALRESPEEVTWLALADWLDEAGEGQRAELVRLVRRLRAVPLTEGKRKCGALEKRLAQLLLSGVRPVVPEVADSGIRLALVPAGRFLVTPSRRRGRSIGEPREVTIERPFWLGVFAVTQRQYEAVMGHNPSHFRAGGPGAQAVAGLDTADFPVEMVS